jgi:predicted pyridoxine 5'-phosphate oxidase superfamily flavin-nucleotide-binding protein
MFDEVFVQCVRDPEGIVSVASVSEEGRPHIANTWNKFLILTDEGKILIPCAGYRRTEENVKNQPVVEISIGSAKVPGKVEMGTGFLLSGTVEFQKEGELFERMHDKCSFANRVLVFTPDTCHQTI